MPSPALNVALEKVMISAVSADDCDAVALYACVPFFKTLTLIVPGALSHRNTTRSNSPSNGNTKVL